MLNLLKGIQKSSIAQDSADLLADIQYTVAELSKIFYTKAAGIDPIFMKHMMPQLGTLLKEPSSQDSLLATLKLMGVVVNEASIVPVRMQ